MNDHFFQHLLARKGRALATVRALTTCWVSPHDERTRLALVAYAIKLGHVVLLLLDLERRRQTSHIVEEAAQGPDVHLEVKRLPFEHLRARIQRSTNLANRHTLRFGVGHRDRYAHICYLSFGKITGQFD